MTPPRVLGASAFCPLAPPRSKAGRGLRSPAFGRALSLSAWLGLLLLQLQPLSAQQGEETSGAAASASMVIKSGALLTRHKFAVDVAGPPVDVELGGRHRSPDGRISTVAAGSWRWLEPGRHRVEWHLSTEKGAEQGRGTPAVQTIDVLPRLEFAASGAALYPSRSMQKVFQGWPALVELVLSGPVPEGVAEVPLRLEGPHSDLVLGQLETTTIAVGAGGHATLRLDLAEVPVGGFVDLVMGHPLNAVRGEIFRHRLQVVAEGSFSTQLFHLRLRQNQRIVHSLLGNVYASLEARPAAAGGSSDFAAGNFDWDVRYVDSEGFATALFDLPTAGGTKSDSLFERIRLPRGPGMLKAKVRFSLEDRFSLAHEAEFPVLSAGGVSPAAGLGFGDGPAKEGNGHSGLLSPRLLPLGSSPENYLQTQLGIRLQLGDTATAIRAKGALVDGSPWRRVLTGSDSETQDEERYASSSQFDFVVSGLDHGASALVVLPLPRRLEAGKDFRLHRRKRGWLPFTTDSRNQIYSARGAGISLCPAPGSYHYGTGLAAGFSCVQLLLEDGGPNDVDGRVNGSVAVLGAFSLPLGSRVYGRGDLLLTLLLVPICLFFGWRSRIQKRAGLKRSPDPQAD